MKKILLASAAVAALSFATSASAADLGAAPRPYLKAAPPVVALNWTGLYIFGGGGGGLWTADNTTACQGCTPTNKQRLGGDGWYGTVGIGYDWQLNDKWVLGLFGDAQFGDMSGTMADSNWETQGTVKMRNAYAAGPRLGYLVAPNVLSYVNAGWTRSEWSGADLLDPHGGGYGSSTPAFNRNGWFVGGGVENNLDLFGISVPGLFMKTEYRAAYFDTATLSQNNNNANKITFKPWTQEVSTSLVYRFNWNGPVVAKY
ncbi:MAG: outer membrane beta-barrel protein [Alphaproteobacteria bacterium]|nr:outer membrane beta-barrel protein [Alphaproteobacteria bacterium]